MIRGCEGSCRTDLSRMSELSCPGGPPNHTLGKDEPPLPTGSCPGSNGMKGVRSPGMDRVRTRTKGHSGFTNPTLEIHEPVRSTPDRDWSGEKE
eukprot:scaffold524_cov357-Pavlova_lutheri.AAC.37